MPADLYGNQYRSIGQDIHSNEICWHILEPPSFHSLHTCNSASPSKSCGCKQNFRSILVKTDVMYVLTQPTCPPYQGVLHFSESTAFMTYIFWNVCSSVNLHLQAVQEYPWLFLDCLKVKMNAPWSFKMPKTTQPTTYSQNPEDLNLQKHQCKNLKPRIIRGSYQKSQATIFCKVTRFIIDKSNTPP